MQLRFRWTDGTDRDFQTFWLKTEEYYNQLAGGAENRRAFVPYNLSESIPVVLIACDEDAAIGCAGLKPYSGSDAEIKRVWVDPSRRGNHIAQEMMLQLEKKAMENGFSRLILQTREVMTDAIRLYGKLGYHRIPNYPPYDRLEGAVCFTKELLIPETAGIRTERLTLTRFTGSDREVCSMLRNWVSDPAIQGEYGEPVCATEADVRRLLNRYLSEPFRWAIHENSSGQCIGQIAFCRIWDDVQAAEIEYCIGAGFQGNGYAGEALAAVIAYAFSYTDLSRLEAWHRAENPRSGRVLEKSSMHLINTVERFRREGASHENAVCYGITAGEWRAAARQPR